MSIIRWHLWAPVIILLMVHSTSGQSYPNCGGNCQRDGEYDMFYIIITWWVVDVVVISQPLLSYTTMRSDDFLGTQPSNDGCISIDVLGTISCGVGTTLMDCERGDQRNINFSDLSDYFVWNRSTSAVRSVSTIFRFDQPVNIRSISMWFWNAPNGGIIIPSLTLYSSSDNFTTSSNQISIDTSNSLVPEDNKRYRLNVDITDEDLMVQSLRIIMTINEGIVVFLSEVQFCGKCVFIE